MVAVLAYWAIRGLAAPIRYLLEYTNTPYEDKHYTQGDGPEFSRAEWMDEKPSLSAELPFANLPYFIDGSVKLTQSNAIIRYIAEKNGLAGSTPEERAMIDMIANEVIDVRSRFTRLCYMKASDFEAFRQGHVTYFRNWGVKMEAFLKQRGTLWACADSISYADFLLFELLSQHVLLESSMLDEFPLLAAYKARFEALEFMRAFMKKPAYSLPLNNKTATFR
ncbi:Glutathione S-transferase Mu 4 [Chytriomyces hyalinus]|nr:Glutathione S-transferase Mu 4 [Chytriomyces hyalinus]